MRRQVILWLAGSAALMIGLLVYLSDRPSALLLLLPDFGFSGGHRWFGAVGDWLPSFVHTLAFSLFTAALVAPGPRSEYGACAFWFAVNAAFEMGQHPQIRGPLTEAMRRVIGQGPVARTFENYFLRGTFDRADLLAIAFGAAVAATILHRLRRSQSHHASTPVPS